MIAERIHGRTPIGVDVDGRWINAAQLRRGRRGWQLSAAASFRRPDATSAMTDDDARRLAGVLRRQGFRGEMMVMAVPASKLLVTPLELPARSTGAPLDAIAHAEVARAHGRDTGALVSAWWEVPAPARATGTGTHALAAACTSADAESLLRPLDGPGLTVQRLDTRAWALGRIASRACDAAPVTAITELMWSDAFFAVVRDGVPVFERLILDAGVRTLLGKVSARLGLEPDASEAVAFNGDASTATESLRAGVELLVREYISAVMTDVRASLEYVRHRYPDLAPTSNALTGAGADLRRCASLAGEMLDLPCTRLAASDIVPVSSDAEWAAGMSALAVPIGLALRCVSSGVAHASGALA